ncbi:MarR family winged helix-turn-helix transcriptional regulator [Amycolatopsis thermophila]|uniref:DNA-binding MarR family transcriptional regulator n=1 Tax=Amycolatopsis thermophila TaxID=206084 RepID=A0ABU0F3W0_9PSEU|nr:MarR family transcriptional regulator [Amycolatopsis thermophila]MDQ0382279.1 DNA-binding MarR family transcriptional regulator [Amycolatopsis thermophila]
MHDERLANLLGALALTVNDLALADATAAAGTSASGSAALVVLSTAPGLSVTELGRRVGLSQPAAARMVDGLEGRGLVERRPTLTRSVAVHLTAAGAGAASRILGERGGRLGTLTAALDPRERKLFADLAGKLLAAAYEQLPEADRLCRLCDRAACVAQGQVCPVGAACRAREAADEPRHRHRGDR